MGKKILVCDDDAGVLDVMSMILELGGYEVVSQSYSAKIYDDIAEHHPSLIILDLWMPLLPGDVISREIKNNPDTKNIPVIISSASRDGAKIARDALADKFLAKPFDLHVLLRTVNELIPA